MASENAFQIIIIFTPAFSYSRTSRLGFLVRVGNQLGAGGGVRRRRLSEFNFWQQQALGNSRFSDIAWQVLNLRQSKLEFRCLHYYDKFECSVLIVTVTGNRQCIPRSGTVVRAAHHCPGIRNTDKKCGERVIAGRRVSARQEFHGVSVYHCDQLSTSRVNGGAEARRCAETKWPELEDGVKAGVYRALGAVCIASGAGVSATAEAETVTPLEC
ncbi:hypothetical protein FA15DRAFT_696117 [Coprinopsis marcescibilis]|uniref:Uncharacterized protein n=1 Tax=Coprinopsis marcescibilis TaxID=230819 RepID=A0A5C3KP26_COPMA|nr:hypothetical protein FA15DRAFT_696117 [Coprinopsis marcescibilis]